MFMCPIRAHAINADRCGITKRKTDLQKLPNIGNFD